MRSFVRSLREKTNYYLYDCANQFNEGTSNKTARHIYQDRKIEEFIDLCKRSENLHIFIKNTANIGLHIEFKRRIVNGREIQYIVINCEEGREIDDIIILILFLRLGSKTIPITADDYFKPNSPGIKYWDIISGLLRLDRNTHHTSQEFLRRRRQIEPDTASLKTDTSHYGPNTDYEHLQKYLKYKKKYLELVKSQNNIDLISDQLKSSTI
jgi:hypothetical protein